MKYRHISIRQILQPGDIGRVTELHGRIYAEEYGYGIGFESYVAAGLHEFWQQYDPSKDRVWLCENGGELAGCLFLMHRNNETAQLRFFLLGKNYRGIGLGSFLIKEFMECLAELGYREAYLWTTDELKEAAALYLKAGFVPGETHESDIFGKIVTEQYYAWCK